MILLEHAAVVALAKGEKNFISAESRSFVHFIYFIVGSFPPEKGLIWEGKILNS